MKIDFHCHTIKTKCDESENRNVTLDLFIQKITESEVKIIAITNHNKFDKEQYILFKNSVLETCQVWPGIELDVKGASGKVGHMIIIANPKDVDNFSAIIDSILNGFSPDNFVIDLNVLYNKIKFLDLVYVVHCFKKKELLFDDIIEFEKIMKNPRRLFKEPSSLTSVTVLQSNKHRVVIGTDVTNWNEYEKCNFGEFKFDLQDFNSFTKIIEKDITFLKDIIDEEYSEDVEVYGVYEEKKYPFKIPIYNDVNIVFGDKGSGKSEILKSLYAYYQENKNDEPVYYEGGNKDDWYNNLIKINQIDYNIENVPQTSKNVDEFKVISDFTDTIPTPLKKYIDYYTKKSNKASKDRMKCLNLGKRHLYNESKYNDKYDEHKKIAKFIKDYKLLNSKKLLTQNEQKKLLDLLVLLYKKSYIDYKDEWIEQKSEFLFDDFTSKIPMYVSENVGEPTPPSETGFSSFAKNRLAVFKSAKKILNDLNEEYIDYSELIGNLGSKGNVFLVKKYCFINSNNKNSIDSKTLKHNKGDLQPYIIHLEAIKNDFDNNSIITHTLEIKNYCELKNIKTMEDFMSIHKNFAIEGNTYTPSKGEKSILSLQHELLSKQERNIFLIDEPDLSLGSTYINEVIVPLFKNLSRTKKILVIATHDANIAVRTRPLNSILKLTDNNIYKTYIGNMFIDKLINIDEDTDILSWKDQSIKYLEGGKEAFSERGDLYE